MKRIFITAIVFISVTFAQAESRTSISLCLPRTVSAIPAAELNGEIVDGCRITVEYYDDHIMAMSEFVSGRVDIFMTGFSQGLARYRAGSDVVMIATPVWGMSSLLTINPSLKNLADFRGKTILVPFAKSPLDLQMREIIKRKDLSGSINIEYAPIQQQIPLLLAGRVDGVSLPEPLATKLAIDHKGIRIFSFEREWASVNKGEGRTPQVSLFARKDFARNNSAMLNLFVKALENKTNFAAKNPQIMAKKYSSVFKINENILAKSLSFVKLEIPDAATSSKLIRHYQMALGDNASLDDIFLRKYK